MKNYTIIACTILVFAIVSSCGSSKALETLKPTADLAGPLTYNKELSYLTIPVSIKLREFENQTNLALKGLIYEDNKISDDDVMFKVWKEAPIKITNEKGKLKIVLPLKIWAKVRYGTSLMGLDFHDERDIYLNGVATIIGDVNFSNWQLKAASKVESVVWKESPFISVAGKRIPITYIVNPALKYFKSTIEQKIDDAIATSMNFQKDVIDGLSKIATPINVNETYDTWFKISPVGLNSTQAVLQKDAVSMNLELACHMETFIGKPKTAAIKKEDIKLSSVTKVKDDFSASLMVISPYLKASEIITKNFENQEFASGSKKITVKKVDLWHKDGKIIMALLLEGSINGTVYLAGIPKYDATKELIYFENLSYVLDTKNKLLKTANWMAHGLILKKIQAYASYSIKPELEQAKKTLDSYLKNYSPTKGVLLNGHAGPITIENIQLTDQALVASVKTKGAVVVKIEGL
ncbi:MAG: DUF4403 family protein [Lutibacter sp.]|nr:DUF4403 family protein [Lutibacter sp.]